MRAQKREFVSSEIGLQNYSTEGVPECPNYLEYIFKNVKILSFVQDGVHGHNNFTETLHFIFESFQWTYFPSNEDGTCYLGEPIQSDEIKS